MDKLFNTKKNERATAYPYIIINEATDKTQFADANCQECRKSKGEQYLKRAL